MHVLVVALVHAPVYVAVNVQLLMHVYISVEVHVHASVDVSVHGYMCISIYVVVQTYASRAVDFQVTEFRTCITGQCYRAWIYVLLTLYGRGISCLELLELRRAWRWQGHSAQEASAPPQPPTRPPTPLRSCRGWGGHLCGGGQSGDGFMGWGL